MISGKCYALAMHQGKNLKHVEHLQYLSEIYFSDLEKSTID